MIVTSRCARWLQSLPESDAAALLDAVARCAADPMESGPRCKRLASNLYEARISLPPSRQYRCMFGLRNGQPVLLIGVLKKGNADHERAIRAARVELASDDIQGEPLMAKNAPIFSGLMGWIYSSNGQQYRVRHVTRKKLLIETAAGLVTLNRSRLEQTGSDVVDGTVYKTTRYWLPSEVQELPHD